VAKKTNADYKREQYARAKEAAEKLGITNRTLPLPATVSTMLDELCERHEFTDWRELVITMIRVAHSGAVELVQIPKSGFVPTERQLRKVGRAPVCAECVELGYLCVECEEVEQ
jgi:hypothetical protein